MNYFTKPPKKHFFLYMVGQRRIPAGAEGGRNSDMYKAVCLETGTVTLMFGHALAKQRVENDVLHTLRTLSKVNHELRDFDRNIVRAKCVPAPWYVWVHYALAWVVTRLVLGKASRDFVWEETL